MALVTTLLEPGGAQHQLFTLGRLLHTRGFQVSMAGLYDRGGYAAAFAERFRLPTTDFRMKADVRTLRPGRSDLLPTLRGIARWARWLRHHHVDVLQTFDFYANVFGVIAGRLARVPAVVTSQRVAYWDRRPLERRIDALLARLADTVVVNSTALRTYATTHGGIPARLIETIFNGVDPEIRHTKRPRDVVRRELNIAPDTPLLVTVARLQPKKGHRILLDAMGSLRHRFDRLEALIVGEGPCAADLVDQARRLELEERVHFLGLRSDVPSLVSASDVFVLPSFFEGMPNALLEAMMLGIPAVATQVEGATDLMEHERHGLLVPVGDAAALAAGIERLLLNSDEARRMADAAQTRALSTFTLDAMGDAYASLYQRLLAQFSQTSRAERASRHITRQPPAKSDPIGCLE